MSQGQWFAVATKPRQEHVAEVNLTRQGYRMVLPMMKVRKRRQNKWTNVIEPLFPGYLFVLLELGKDNLAPIRSTLGCRDLVRIGLGLVPVPDAVMTPLLSLSSSPKTSDVLFGEGDKVALVAGPFAGLQGVFKLAKGKDRAEVFVALLGKERPIAVALNDLAFPQWQVKRIVINGQFFMAVIASFGILNRLHCSIDEQLGRFLCYNAMQTLRQRVRTKIILRAEYHTICMNEERQIKAMRLLRDNPEMTQRQLAKALGISLGAVNFCLKALADKGWLKMANFKNNPSRLGYLYLLTPRGIAAKTRLTAQFLKRKLIEYDELKSEIETLEKELRHQL